MMKRFVFYSAASLLCLVSACKTDVPVPDDQRAQFWTPSIKASYPNWQPPMTMPKGNPEYEAEFQAKQEVSPVAEAKEPELKLELEKPEAPAPKVKSGLTRIDVTDTGAQDVYVVNGEPIPGKDMAAFLKDLAVSDPSAILLVYVEERAAAEKLNRLLGNCKDAKLASVNVVRERDVFGGSPLPPKPVKKAQTPRTNARPRTVYVVDDTQAPQTHVIQKNESLSGIAKQYYKDGSLWWAIYHANKDVIKDANRLIPGKSIKIPVVKAASNAVSKAEPAKADAAVKDEAVKAEPAKADAAVKDEAVKAEPVKTDAAVKDEAVKTEPVKTDAAVKEAPAKAEPVKAEPAKVDSGKAEPVKAGTAEVPQK